MMKFAKFVKYDKTIREGYKSFRVWIKLPFVGIIWFIIRKFDTRFDKITKIWLIVNGRRFFQKVITISKYG